MFSTASSPDNVKDCRVRSFQGAGYHTKNKGSREHIIDASHTQMKQHGKELMLVSFPILLSQWHQFGIWEQGHTEIGMRKFPKRAKKMSDITHFLRVKHCLALKVHLNYITWTANKQKEQTFSWRMDENTLKTTAIFGRSKADEVAAQQSQWVQHHIIVGHVHRPLTEIPQRLMPASFLKPPSPLPTANRTAVFLFQPSLRTI